MQQGKCRRSIRLPQYDYTNTGAYFVTICAQNHQCLLGNISNGEMILSDSGIMVHRWYQFLESKFDNLICDYFVCMPNHVHFIIQLGQAHWPAPTKVSLNEIVHWFKTMTTNNYIRGVKEKGWTRFDKRLWQRNYWERVIRNEAELQKFKNYILNNPLRWHLDRLNPINQ